MAFGNERIEWFLGRLLFSVFLGWVFRCLSVGTMSVERVLVF